jgi:DNA polymerase-3 subunit epsilon
MREIILDVETTGLDPKSGHRIIELAAVEVIDKTKTSNIFHRFINPERDISPGAFKIHGISDQFLADKPKFHEVAHDFLAFIGDGFLIIHNASFDMKFINAELWRIGLTAIEYSRTIDTLTLARRMFPGSPVSLDALCRRFNICTKIRKEQGHGALIDAELLYKVYLYLTGHVRTELFQAEKVATKSAANTKKQRVLPSRCFVHVQDNQKHQRFVSTIEGKIWDRVFDTRVIS